MNRILFVCSANKDRSRTAEDHFRFHYPEVSFDSAGTNKKICNQLGTTYLSQDQLEVADGVYVMEQKHADAIKTMFGNSYYSKITVLHIKDLYAFGSKELISLLESKIRL